MWNSKTNYPAINVCIPNTSVCIYNFRATYRNWYGEPNTIFVLKCDEQKMLPGGWKWKRLGPLCDVDRSRLYDFGQKIELWWQWGLTRETDIHYCPFYGTKQYFFLVLLKWFFCMNEFESFDESLNPFLDLKGWSAPVKIKCKLSQEVVENNGLKKAIKRP